MFMSLWQNVQDRWVLKVVIFIAFLMASAVTIAATPLNVLPKNAEKYAPVLKQVIDKKWANLNKKSAIAGQVEKESCITLKHSKCWSPTAELKTSREYGFGVGQLTIAYNKDGSERFNNFTAVKKLDVDLSAWKWENRFQIDYQFLAMVAMDKNIYSKLPSSIKGEDNRLTFMFAAYNGGLGGTLQDRRLCAGTAGCDPNLWYGNVENTSMKNKVKIAGYGKSFFDINREYPKEIEKRRLKYVKIMES